MKRSGNGVGYPAVDQALWRAARRRVTGVGLEKSNPWEFDARQCDSILKRLKVQRANKDDKVEEDDAQVESESEKFNDGQDSLVKATRPQGRLKYVFVSEDVQSVVKKVKESPELYPTEDGVLEIVEASNSEGYISGGDNINR
ncbi:hypothetical protein Ddye_028717 [Dipteronia dyeriana]|uniref:Uncharacterized protein n=1 Tax=Dipteronia dyeriana TaxID=168575 RepID=A0AAD9TDW1_9ROSI|nr:hypothetical protein Ddye_028717 [Dipteronia dyeriana]